MGVLGAGLLLTLFNNSAFVLPPAPPHYSSVPSLPGVAAASADDASPPPPPPRLAPTLAARAPRPAAGAAAGLELSGALRLPDPPGDAARYITFRYVT